MIFNVKFLELIRQKNIMKAHRRKVKLKEYTNPHLTTELLFAIMVGGERLAWMNNHIICLIWDPITHMCHHSISSLAKLLSCWGVMNINDHTQLCFVCRIKTGSGGVCCHNAWGRVRNRKSNPDGVAGGIWRTVRTSPSALWQQTPTDRS